jgi:hypothetical protein
VIQSPPLYFPLTDPSKLSHSAEHQNVWGLHSRGDKHNPPLSSFYLTIFRIVQNDITVPLREDTMSVLLRSEEWRCSSVLR